MLNLLIGASAYVFPCGRAVKLFKSGINITNSTSQITFGTNISLTIIECCAPPGVRLSGHCGAAASLLTFPVISPNPMTIGASIHVIGELYENC